MSWVVSKALGLRKFASTSSYLLTKPAKKASKRATKMPKNTLKVFSNNVRKHPKLTKLKLCKNSKIYEGKQAKG